VVKSFVTTGWEEEIREGSLTHAPEWVVVAGCFNFETGWTMEEQPLQSGMTFTTEKAR
jgi:hypothetical protein